MAIPITKAEPDIPMICSGGYVRGYQRCPDCPPGQRPAGEEVVTGVLAMTGSLPGHPLRQRQERDGVDTDDDKVNGSQVHPEILSS